jgi:hypothetical protein
MLFTEHKVIENIHFMFFTEICEEHKVNKKYGLGFVFEIEVLGIMSEFIKWEKFTFVK